MVHGGNTLVKYLLFFFNFLFVITGILLIVFGALAKTSVYDFSKYLGNQATDVAVFMIVLGVIVFFIAFLGCCGAVKENHCMILTFSVLLFIIFIMEIAGGIAAYVFRNKIHDLLDTGFKEQIQNYKPNVTSSSWDDIQHTNDCCGSTNYTDWNINSLYNHTDTFPDSCCRDHPVHTICNVNSTSLNSKGCLYVFEDTLKNHMAQIGGAGIGIGFVEVVGIIFSCCLARAIRKQYETV